MKQVFFITEDRLTVMLWKKTELLAEYIFRWRENDNSDIRQYLEDSVDIESEIILDVLEEEITITAIPHVFGRDRKALVERTINRLHRNSTFTYGKIIGRVDNRRRDDRLLVSGITSEKTLARWIDLFKEYGIKIKGIYSLPILSGNVLKVVKKRKGLVLLISQQADGFIRQSVFNDGALFYSRNIPITDNLTIERMSEDMQKTQKYLENQKVLSSGVQMEVVFMVNNALFNAMQGLDNLLPLMNISYVHFESLKKALSIESEYPVNGREIYSALLIQQGCDNQYARASDTETYRMRRNRLWMNVASVVMTFLLLSSAAGYYYDSQVVTNKMITAQSKLNAMRQGNNMLQQKIMELPLKTRQMKLLVDNLEELKFKNSARFDHLLVDLSQVLQGFRNIELSELNWKYNAAQQSRSRGRAVEKDSKMESLQLKATMMAADITREKAVRRIELFLEALRGLKRVTNVALGDNTIRATSEQRLTGTASSGSKEIEFSVMIQLERT